MGKLTKEHLQAFLKTSAGEKGLRIAASVVSKEIISAAKYYVGQPDELYFTSDEFDESVVKAKKAYITLNTLMGGETAEEDRFSEGKKQIPGLITEKGIKKMINLFTHLYLLGTGNTSIPFETVRACRQTEISEGVSFVGPLTSTTKLSVEEIMNLGYGDKNGLAICRYKFYDGAVVFDMEELGVHYSKPEEREVLILTGNKLLSRCCGYDNNFAGKDGKPAMVYEIEVYPPEFFEINEIQEELEEIVYNPKTIAEVKKLFKELNEEGEFPEITETYKEWKKAFQKLVHMELKKMS